MKAIKGLKPCVHSWGFSKTGQCGSCGGWGAMDFNLKRLHKEGLLPEQWIEELCEKYDNLTMDEKYKS